jgi:predicted nucleotidyltransferase component of viral defense system
MKLYNYDKVFLGRKAKELGFNRDTLEKVTRLYDILRFLNTIPLLKKNLALKGGTAINFTMLDLPRLSVDIDLDFANNCKKEEMLNQRKTINDAIHKYMIREGYEFSPKSKSPHSLDSLVYRYIGVSGNYDNIKIEINYSLRAHIDQTEYVYANHPLFTNDFKIHRLSTVEVFGSKINALMTRAASRDLYDVYNMIKYNLIKDGSQRHLRKSIILYHALTTRNEHKAFNIEIIDSINERMVKRDLKPVLSKGDSFNLKEAQKEVKKYIQKILTFTEEEKRFIDFFNNNKFEPSLLFDDTQVLKRIESHPMALWRTR